MRISIRFTSGTLLILASLGCIEAQADTCLDVSEPTPELCLVRQGWTLKQANSNMDILIRRKKGSRLYELIAITYSVVSVKRLKSVITDYENYPSFIPYVETCHILHHQDGIQWVFQQLDLPWPIADRFHTIQFSTKHDKNGHKIQWKLAEENTFKQNGRGIETPHYDGFWLLQPRIRGELTRMIYSTYTNPGSQLPNWVINLANRDKIIKVIDSIRRKAEEDLDERSSKRLNFTD